jgi:hypothetical protein
VKRDPLPVHCTTNPGNSQFVVVFDTTRGLALGDQVAVASGNARLVPLSTDAKGRRGAFTGAALRGTILCTTQNVTLLQQDLTGVAGAATDWETQGTAGSVTITAGTTQPFEFKPLAPDWRLVVQAGATGPDSCVVKLAITWGEDYGS